MRKFFQELLDFFRKGDMVLLALCIATTILGVVILSSVTNHMGATRFVVVQLVGAVLGIFLGMILMPLISELAGALFAVGFLLVYGGVIIAVIVGVIVALNQRLREIESGEEEEAKKY